MLHFSHQPKTPGTFNFLSPSLRVGLNKFFRSTTEETKKKKKENYEVQGWASSFINSWIPRHANDWPLFFFFWEEKNPKFQERQQRLGGTLRASIWQWGISVKCFYFLLLSPESHTSDTHRGMWRPQPLEERELNATPSLGVRRN